MSKPQVASRLRSLAFWDALRERYPLASRWELVRPASSVAAANFLTARALWRGEMRPWELVALVALEALALTLIAGIQLRFVPVDARPPEEGPKKTLAQRIGAFTFLLLWLSFIYGVVFAALLQDSAPLKETIRDPWAFLRGSAIRWPLLVAVAGALLDAVADWRFWKGRGGTFVSTPGFTAMARWLTLILGGIPFFMPLAIGGFAIAGAAKWVEKRSLASRGDGSGRTKGWEVRGMPLPILLFPVLGIGLLWGIGHLVQSGREGWILGYLCAKVASELFVLGVPLIAERAGREEREALAAETAPPAKKQASRKR